MGLFGSPEVAALYCDFKHGKFSGVKVRKKARGGCEVVGSACFAHSDWNYAVSMVLKELSWNSSVYLILSVVLDNCEVFECSMLHSGWDDMREALRFEVPRHVMSMPEDFRLQFVPLSDPDENGMQKVRCAVFPEASLHKLCNQIAQINCRCDVVINPLLALPRQLGPSGKVLLDGMEEGFCWGNGSWQINDNKNINVELDDFLRTNCSGGYDLSRIRTALTAARFGVEELFGSSRMPGGLTILPDFLRPARFRTQLRVMAVLAVLLVGVNLFSYAGDFMSSYKKYSQLRAQVKNASDKNKEMRRKIKAAEKLLKVTQRTAELKIGSRDCLAVLGYLSEKLPDDVAVSNFRWNEGSIDLNVQTTSPDLDLVSFFNRLEGFKVVNASQRKNPMNNFTTASVKLTLIEEDKMPQAKVKSKNKAKKK